MLPAGEMEFAGHEVLTPDPATALNFPATHCVHDPPLGPDEPALQMQAELPAVLSEKAGHDVHACDPAASLYVFVGQSVQEPGCPVNPGGQFDRQSDSSSLPAVETESDGHSKHVESAAAPTVVEYLPESQSVHVPGPADVLNFPATHCVHGPPSGPVEPGSH